MAKLIDKKAIPQKSHADIKECLEDMYEKAPAVFAGFKPSDPSNFTAQEVEDGMDAVTKEFWRQNITAFKIERASKEAAEAARNDAEGTEIFS